MHNRRDEFGTLRPSGQSRVLGWLSRSWSLALIAFAVITVTLLGWWGNAVGWGIFILSYVLARLIDEVLARSSIGAWIRSKRHLAPDGLRAQESDTRPPVLYLRSFSVDNVTAGTGARGRAIFRTEEEQLAWAFKGFGPFVAIGRPGEPLPPAGAARIYTPDSGWQQSVLELIRKAGLILIGAGTGAGLMWEIDQVVSLIPPEKIIVLVPFGKDAYDDFRSRAEAHFGHTLPSWVEGSRRSPTGIRAAVYFDPDWTSHFVRLDTEKRVTLEKSCYKWLGPAYSHNGVKRPGAWEQVPASEPVPPPAEQRRPRRRLLGRPRSLGVRLAISIAAGLCFVIAVRWVTAHIFTQPTPAAYPNLPSAQGSAAPALSPAATLAQPEVAAVAFSPSGTTLAATDFGGTTYLWDMATHALTATLRPPAKSSDFFSGVAFSPSGTTLAAGNVNGRTYLWNAATHALIATLRDPAGQGVRSMAFSPDGKTLATGDVNGRAYLWNVTTHALIVTLHSPASGEVRSVAFSPDGKALATADASGSTYLWNVTTHALIATLPDPDSTGVYSVAFSPDGKTLAAGEFLHANAYLWNAATHSVITSITDPEVGFTFVAVAFSPDGKTLVTGLDVGTYLWDVSRLRP